jgi:type I protein arginine methyltransferase
MEPGQTAADLGCGFGVLGLLCLRAGAARVWGIEHGDAIEIARETMWQAGLAESYQCIRGSTFHVELPEPVDLIICDHVGYFGFDYGIIAMMQDARKRLLKPGGTMIPERLRLVMAGVSGKELRKEADFWQQDSIPGEFGWLREYAVNTRYSALFDAAQLCTDPVEVGTIDLATDDSANFRFNTEIVVNRACTFDGLGGWFDCDLAAGVTMTNSPLAADRIGRSQAFLPCAEPIAVEAGDRIGISLRFSSDGDLISWTITPPGGQARQRLTTWKSRILKPSDLDTNQDRPRKLSQIGRARLLVLQSVDGKRSAHDIEQAVLQAHGNLFPSAEAIRKFVRRELGTGTE